jgi:hypothetical protein
VAARVSAEAELYSAAHDIHHDATEMAVEGIHEAEEYDQDECIEEAFKRRTAEMANEAFIEAQKRFVTLGHDDPGFILQFANEILLGCKGAKLASYHRKMRHAFNGLPQTVQTTKALARAVAVWVTANKS